MSFGLRGTAPPRRQRPGSQSDRHTVVRRVWRDRNVRVGKADTVMHLQAGRPQTCRKVRWLIDQFGVALGEVTGGRLIWDVMAATKGHPAGALAGSYSGVGANASIGVGAGANVLVGGTGRAFSLQPVSVQGET